MLGSPSDVMHYMSAPLSIRFDPKILERLGRRARVVPGATPSGLAERLVDEGLRMAEHPGMVFKNGPSGRRAALALGPDVWEVVKASREMDERGEAAVLAVADLPNLVNEQVRAALRYYADHPGKSTQRSLLLTKSPPKRRRPGRCSSACSREQARRACTPPR